MLKAFLHDLIKSILHPKEQLSAPFSQKEMETWKYQDPPEVTWVTTYRAGEYILSTDPTLKSYSQ